MHQRLMGNACSHLERHVLQEFVGSVNNDKRLLKACAILAITHMLSAWLLWLGALQK